MRRGTQGTCRVRRGLAVVVGLLTLAGSSAAAQSVASIVGQVTDQSGGRAAWCHRDTTSPALQVPQITAVTNEVGEYRLAPLPIGAYEVAFDSSGFQPIRRQDIRLTVGFTARLDVQLAVSSVTESVTVSGAAPVVDVASTSGSTLLTNEILELSATSRNSVMSVLTMAPGVRSSATGSSS